MVRQTTPTVTVEDGVKYYSWSEVKTWQRCPKQWDYKYGQDLVPRRRQRPLFLGSWVHSCLEAYYTQGDWKIGHAPYVAEWNKLFDEEREELGKKGPLPDLVKRIIQSYLWYYRDDPWEVLYVEQEFKVKLKGDVGVKGIIDLVVRDAEGLIWVIDHKTASTIPEATAFHAMDPQLMVYPWAASKVLGIEPAGIIYNYVKSKPPSLPKLNKDDSLSKRKISTDYPTAFRFLKENGYDPKEFAALLKPLQRRSPFLRRYKLPREKVVTLSVLQDFLTSSIGIRDHTRTPRVITRDCARGCGYHDICRSELNGFDTSNMRKQEFTLRSKEQDYVEPEVENDDSTKL